MEQSPVRGKKQAMPTLHLHRLRVSACPISIRKSVTPIPPVPLSDTAIRKAKPRSRPFKLSDGGGLFLLIQPSGSKWWRFKYRFAGKEKLLALGSYPEVSLAEAREKHFMARKALAAGTDPSGVKQEAKRLVVAQKPEYIRGDSPGVASESN
jgi:hypothetical protein